MKRIPNISFFAFFFTYFSFSDRVYLFPFLFLSFFAFYTVYISFMVIELRFYATLTIITLTYTVYAISTFSWLKEISIYPTFFYFFFFYITQKILYYTPLYIVYKIENTLHYFLCISMSQPQSKSFLLIKFIMRKKTKTI